MPKYYLLPKRLVDRVSWIETPVWMLEAGAFQLLLGVARILPYPAVAFVFSRILGTLGYRNAKKRRVVRRNIAHVMPEASETAREAIVRQVFRATGLAAAELFLLDRLWRHRARRIEFDIHPEVKTVIRPGQGIIFATAHAGAWQLCNFLGRHEGFAPSVLYARERNPWLHRFFLARRRAFGGRMVPSTGGARDFIRELAAGHWVGAAFDTRVDQGEMVPFFGVAAPTNTLPAILALRGYPLVPIRTVRLPGHRFRIEVLAPLRPRDPHAPRKAQVSDLTAQLNDLFEAWIREDPGQWICMKRRWPKPGLADAEAATDD